MVINGLKVSRFAFISWLSIEATRVVTVINVKD